MKKILAMVAVVGMLFVAPAAFAQNDSAKTDSAATTQVDAAADQAAVPAEGDMPVHQQIKTKFIEGGPLYMAPNSSLLNFRSCNCN